MSERENVQNGDDDQEVDVGEIANQDEKTRVESEKEKVKYQFPPPHGIGY